MARDGVRVTRPVFLPLKGHGVAVSLTSSRDSNMGQDSPRFHDCGHRHGDLADFRNPGFGSCLETGPSARGQGHHLSDT